MRDEQQDLAVLKEVPSFATSARRIGFTQTADLRARSAALHSHRRWYDANTGHAIKHVKRPVQHPILRWMAATLNGLVEGTGSVFEAKFRKPKRTWPTTATSTNDLKRPNDLS